MVRFRGIIPFYGLFIQVSEVLQFTQIYNVVIEISLYTLNHLFPMVFLWFSISPSLVLRTSQMRRQEAPRMAGEEATKVAIQQLQQPLDMSCLAAGC